MNSYLLAMTIFCINTPVGPIASRPDRASLSGQLLGSAAARRRAVVAWRNSFRKDRSATGRRLISTGPAFRRPKSTGAFPVNLREATGQRFRRLARLIAIVVRE